MSNKEYNFGEIEKKWQDFWESNGLFRVDNEYDKDKFYCLGRRNEISK
jgi:leucyl-tRNA synthetase